jgi:predicted nucleotidyltransferase
MINPALNIPAQKLAKFCQNHHINRLSLFGSAARNDFGPDSDIDLMVEFEEGQAPSLSGFLQIKDELETLLGRKVDLVTKSILQNPYRRASILRDMEQLYVSDHKTSLSCQITVKTVSHWQ